MLVCVVCTHVCVCVCVCVTKIQILEQSFADRVIYIYDQFLLVILMNTMNRDPWLNGFMLLGILELISLSLFGFY